MPAKPARDWIHFGPTGPSKIIAEIAAKHGLSLAEITSRDRCFRIAHPRQEAMYELRRRTQLSLPQIAHRLGVKNHTTVIYGVRAHAKRMGAG
jgi:chromosomal replication initiator protein